MCLLLAHQDFVQRKEQIIKPAKKDFILRRNKFAFTRWMDGLASGGESDCPGGIWRHHSAVVIKCEGWDEPTVINLGNGRPPFRRRQRWDGAQMSGLLHAFLSTLWEWMVLLSAERGLLGISARKWGSVLWTSYPGCPSVSMFPRLSTYDSHVSVQCGCVWQVCGCLFAMRLWHLLCWQNESRHLLQAVKIHERVWKRKKTSNFMVRQGQPSESCGPEL